MGLLIASPAATAVKPDVDALAEAARLLGAADLQTLRYGATGAGTATASGITTSSAADTVTPVRYEAAIDYPAAAMQVEIVRQRHPLPDESGAPVMEEREVQAVAQGKAWDVPFAPAPALPPQRGVRSGRKPARGAPTAETPRLNTRAADERRAAIWATPHGFLRAALAHQPALRPAGSGTEVSFYSSSGRYVGFINTRHEVERVRVWMPDPAGGSLLLDTTYTGYAPFGRIRFPARILEQRTGAPPLELTVATVQPNATVVIALPPAFAD